MASIRTIAEQTGLGYSTVAQILQGRRNYRAETIDLVLRVAAETGYAPNFMSRSLAGGKSMLLGFFLDSLSSVPATAMLYPLNRLAQERGYSVFFSARPASASAEERFRELRSYKLDGLLVHSTEMPNEADAEFLRRLNIPIVFIDSSLIPEYPGVIRLDFTRALAELADTLAKCGHDRGQALLADYFLLRPDRLISLYRKAFDAKGIEFAVSPEWICDGGEKSDEAAYELTMRNLRAGRMPGALLLCSNDLIALGAMAAIHDFGLRVPEDISVVGRDGIPVSRVVRPALATIRRPSPEAVTEAAFQMLMQMLASPGLMPSPVTLEAEFQLGNTINSRR